ncbi:unnamed protein product [Lactuca saligna]|uniref:Uncharacterized protein n=1 Tax=Lactuca saligna TaxID=75948 RepID=A0AA36E295_LACSI|nr:unnamed protein product [Lactuca saligna]
MVADGGRRWLAISGQTTHTTPSHTGRQWKGSAAAENSDSMAADGLTNELPVTHDPHSSKTHLIIGLGSHLGKRIDSGSGAVTEATPGEVAAIEVVPKVVAARDPYSDLVSNMSLG